MIFITVGTQPQQFKRLFDEVMRLERKGFFSERVIIQAGTNDVTNLHSHHFEIFDYLPIDQIREYIDQARVVISHGGSGSIITALKMGKKVIGVPRLAKYGEHINDHQVDLIKVLAQDNLILPVYDIEDMGSKLNEIDSFIPNEFQSGTSLIISDIKNFIDFNK